MPDTLTVTPICSSLSGTMLYETYIAGQTNLEFLHVYDYHCLVKVISVDLIQSYINTVCSGV